MSSATLTNIQAASAAISALTAAYLVRLTVRQSKDLRRFRDGDVVQEQLRRIVDSLKVVQEVVRDQRSYTIEIDVATAQLATALAMRPVNLPCCALLLADDMPKPPYHMGETEHVRRVEAAAAEVRTYARGLGSGAS